MQKPTGTQGSWFATWKGVAYPCVHRHWAKPWPNYDDPNVDDRPQWPEFLRALQTGKKALLTKSDIPEGETGSGWRRSGYVAIYAIDDVEVRDGHLTFQFSERLVNF